MLTRYKLRELIDVTRGMSLPGENYSEEGKLIRLTLGNFNYTGGGFKENTSKKDIYYTGDVKEDYILKKGDIITPLTEQTAGLLGSTAMIPESGKYIQSQDVALITTWNQDKIDHLFCYYLISSDVVRKQLSAAAQQTKIRHTSPDKIMDCVVWVPELSLQQKIGKALYTIDKKISLNTRLNAELEAMAKQLYDYWFVQFDFPDENGKPYKSSGGKMVYNEKLKRDIPEGWEVKRIGNIAEIKSGYPFKSELMNEVGEYKIVTIRNVQDNYLDLTNVTCIDSCPNNIKEYCILKEGDILISLTGNVGRVCVVYRDGLLLNQRVGVIKPKQRVSQWCHRLFLDKSIRSTIENWANGCAQANVSPLDIENILIAQPELSIIKEFEIIAKPFIKRQIELAKQNDYLTHLRDSLLPMLMNGQVVVCDDDVLYHGTDISMLEMSNEERIQYLSDCKLVINALSTHCESVEAFQSWPADSAQSEEGVIEIHERFSGYWADPLLKFFRNSKYGLKENALDGFSKIEGREIYLTDTEFVAKEYARMAAMGGEMGLVAYSMIKKVEERQLNLIDDGVEKAIARIKHFVEERKHEPVVIMVNRKDLDAANLIHDEEIKNSLSMLDLYISAGYCSDDLIHNFKYLKPIDFSKCEINNLEEALQKMFMEWDKL